MPVSNGSRHQEHIDIWLLCDFLRNFLKLAANRVKFFNVLLISFGVVRDEPNLIQKLTSRLRTDVET